jgi:FKBP-type peptidyl-prolyl cis-trans isomerase
MQLRKNEMKLDTLGFLFTVTMLGTLACGDGSGGLAGLSDDSFAPELNVDLSAMTQTPSGLYYQDLEVGSGTEALSGANVTVHYTGWLTDGTKFDSSVDRGTPFVFPLGAGRVIAGWDEGVSGMLVGGKRKLVIPADLAYGDRGAGNAIPPGATLVFDVELLDAQ